MPTDPRFGRTEENFGEDPALVAAMGVAAVTGLHAGQMGGPATYLPARAAIVSEAKHAAAYAFGGKDGAATDVSDRTLHDIYLRPWAAYAAAGGRAAMMAHNSINAAPCHSSALLMNWLRAQGTFNESFLASDMCDVGLLARGFHTASSLQDAGVQAMAAGLDQELCNPTDGRGQAFPLVADAVQHGLLAQAALDRAAANVLRAKFAAGLFDGRAFVDTSNLGLVGSADHRALARRAAAESMVLLQNNNKALPLAMDPQHPLTVAVVGPLAGCANNASECVATRSQCGGYSNDGINVTTVLAAAFAEPGLRVLYAPGCEVGGSDQSAFAAALAVAQRSDAVVFVGGDSGNLGWNQNTCGEDDDRADLELPGVQADLLDALAGLNKTTVAVLIHGRPVTFLTHNLLARVDAVVAAWRPGCEGGPALWDVLSGRTSPSGRLAQAWVRRVGQVKSQASPWFAPIQGDFDRVPYNGDVIALGGGSQPMASWSPQFPFGFGLSYTSFNLALLNVTANATAVVVRVNVTNTGPTYPSKQVVGVYYSMPLSRIVRAHKRLLAFAKTAVLAPGASTTLTIAAPVADLATYDLTAGRPLVEPGSYVITVGPDSDTVAGTATITVS